MCGLFLVVERARSVDAARARAATEALRHRGPDGGGEYFFQRTYEGREGPVTVNGFVGHRRLSILDPSARSSQPFRRGDQTLAYNGEIYNFRALRQQLSRDGARFDTDGDTEVLLSLLQRKGMDGLAEANGMWAFCLLDERSGTLWSARDRYGKKPLFYYYDHDTVCVASEISPIMAYLGRAPGMVQADIDSFLRTGWLFPHADGATHIGGIRQVQAGGFMSFDFARWARVEQRYFDLAQYAADGERSGGEALAELVRDAVLARLVSDRKVGLLLSGGVDSSLILSVLCAAGLADNVTCFTGDAGKSEDASYAQRCIAQLGIKAVNIPLDYGASSMASFLQVCRHQEKPFPFIGNALAMPQLYAQIATHDVPVVLDGTGGDEVFAGYWYRYYRFALTEALAQGNRQWVDDSIAANADDPEISGIAQQVLRAGTSCYEPDARSTGIVRASDDPTDMDTFVEPGVRRALDPDPLARFDGSLAQALVADSAGGRLQEWLWQNDRNAMMSGIENRSPLLDHRLAPYMHSGYAKKFVGVWNKHELRALFPRFVALPTQWRRDKQGFRWVYSRFLRNNRDEVLQLIASSRMLPDRVDVSRLLDLARKDDAYLGSSLLHRMLCIAGLEQSTGLVAGSADSD